MKLAQITINTIFSSLLSSMVVTSGLFIINFSDENAIAQDCFMINSRGRRVDLSSLCGISDSKTTPTTPQTPKSAKTEPNGTIKIRIKRFKNKIPIIDVVFNGDRSYEMVFDTGASHTLITSEMAKSLSVVPYNYADFNIADGSNVKFPVGEVKSIEIGSLKMQVFPLVIAEKSNIGLLGHDFFGGFDIKIGQSEIELFPRKGLVSN